MDELEALILELRSVSHDISDAKKGFQFDYSNSSSGNSESTKRRSAKPSPLTIESKTSTASDLDDILHSLNSGFDEFDLGPPSPTLETPTTRPLISIRSPPPISNGFRSNFAAKALVETTLKCKACNSSIKGAFIKIDESTVYHPEHFKCQAMKQKMNGISECGRQVTPLTFTIHNDILHCKSCYTEATSEKCEYCHMPIKDKCIHALGKAFHPYHFFCFQCGKPFESVDVELKYMEHEGQAYCDDDYMALFANICGGCALPISGQAVQAIDKKWHSKCLRCAGCPRVFDANEDIFELNEKPLCAKHYYEQIGSVCARCSKSIVGKCINALGKRYHTNHFICSHCHKDLNGEAFKGKDGVLYCTKCETHIFG